MLEAVFHGHMTFVVTASAITAASAVVAFLLARARSDRPALIAVWVASAVGAVCLTMWSTGGTGGVGRCVVNLSLFEPFHEVQGRLNLAMFVPLGFLGALVTRRMVPAAAAGVILSAGIETIQGAFPVLGRACDTSDLVANSSGAVIGAIAGWLVVRIGSGKRPPMALGSRVTVVAPVVVAVLLGTTWATSIVPTTVAATSAIGPASPGQEAAAREAVARAFGDYYPIKKVQFTSLDGRIGTVTAFLSAGMLDVSWPDRTSITADLVASDSGPESGYPVQGVAGPAASDRDAVDIATAYARQRFPSDLPGSQVTVEPVGDNASLGWLVSRRRYRDNVLMPMRLDVQVDRAGRISQLSAVDVADPAELPTVTVSKDIAGRTALNLVPSCQKVEVGDLLAVRHEGAWRTVWRTVVTCADTSEVINVDAHSGTVESRQTFRAPPNRSPRPAAPGGAQQ
ncbi:hypothetical protein GCM10010441_35170 [Kitasatospora paracochleata]|uniref:VanZ-like domain-containing protein n=1 Tax=Kitasatospora paracochleata TaxID=58354 RepID=A0ABT1IQB0_9ACTN|nr:VanZ family protein [Kitasatospora paracochleata]MCP2307309.1 hypothetical protein [Kitasatospora paracochleata]